MATITPNTASRSSMMKDRLRVELLGRRDKSGRNLYRLTDDYSFSYGDGFEVVVPSGFVTNLGTIPRGLRWVVSPSDLREASVVHDYLLQERLARKQRGKHLVSRWMADAILYEAMEQVGIPFSKRTLVFLGVRFFSLFR